MATAGEIKPDDLYRKCPEPKCHYGTISEYEQGPNATHTSRCWTCNGIGFVPAAPAPTDALRVAAQGAIAAIHRSVPGIRPRQRPHDEPCGCVDCELWQAETTLRAALDGVPAPVALTDVERKELASAIRKAALFVTFADEPGRDRSALERSQLGLDAVLANLREMRPELDWLVAE